MKTFHLAFLLNSNISATNLHKVAAAVETQHPEIRIKILIQEQVDQDPSYRAEAWAILDRADFIFIAIHGSITAFKEFNNCWDRYKETKKLFFRSTFDDEVDQLLPHLNIRKSEYVEIYKYFATRTYDNLYAMVLYLATHFGGEEYSYDDPAIPQWDGIYYKGREWSKEEMMAKITEARAAGRPSIGLLFHYRYYEADNIAHIDHLIEELEQQGALCYPVYTTAAKDMNSEEKGIDYALHHYYLSGETVLVDTIINTLGYAMTYFSASEARDNTATVFRFLKIPIIQAYSLFVNRSKWEEKIQGLDTASLISSVYYPEFDGQIDGYPFATKEYDKQAGSHKLKSMAERTAHVARLAINWARVSAIDNAEKRVAIILHNMPPRNNMIGSAAGLDTAATMQNILHTLKEEGFTLDTEYESGDALIRLIAEGVTNDVSWLDPEVMIDKAAATVPTDDYLTWYRELPTRSQATLEKLWGQPPGTFRHVDNRFPIPGLINGNLFIGLQPPRGTDEQAEVCYHSAEITCPHQYIAFYKWVQHSFKADIILHVGTHGTLEWLPGKEKGLSNACFPNISIGTLPHLYLYHVTVIGEGMQAKRRSSATLINHLEPASVESGTYDKLDDLDGYIKEYLESLSSVTSQSDHLEGTIRELAFALNMHKDLNYSEEIPTSEFKPFVERLHVWVETIKQSTIKDGLHIFGEMPPPQRFQNFVRMLVRLPNGEHASLPDAIGTAEGYCYTAVIDDLGAKHAAHRTGYMLLDEWTAIAVELIAQLAASHFEADAIPPLLNERYPNGDTEKLKDLLLYICHDVVPRLRRTTEELYWLREGLNGRFVSPGAGGSPTRGNVAILPTGKNMYAIDPTSVPSRSAYRVGSQMAKKLISRYQQDTGELPESIGIIIYAGDQMRTSGEDIAEILYLMGVRPVWLGDTSRVTGLELIPLEELQRPRLDVTSRISGLFRDTFPNIIVLIDSAVKLAANADEPIEQNYLRKHLLEDLEEMRKQGIDKETAYQEAMLRVFACPPGHYGGGVGVLIESKEWASRSDLGDISMTWSCHGYSSTLHGKVCRATYEKRLSQVTLTVKNETTIDFDIFDIDDEYIYHGGMIAAVTKLTGKAPKSYYGNSSDPQRLRVASVHEESARLVKARLLNPKWIDGLKAHGYKGAQDVSFNLDNLYGWDATADIIDDWTYQQLTDHFLFDEANRQWIEQVNPWALYHMAERLLEAIQREMWDADEETIARLQEIYLSMEGDFEGKTL